MAFSYACLFVRTFSFFFLFFRLRDDQDAGMDIDQLVNDRSMESAMDADAKEVVGLLRKVLATHPK